MGTPSELGQGQSAGLRASLSSEPSFKNRQWGGPLSGGGGCVDFTLAKFAWLPTSRVSVQKGHISMHSRGTGQLPLPAPFPSSLLNVLESWMLCIPTEARAEDYPM